MTQFYKLVGAVLQNWIFKKIIPERLSQMFSPALLYKTIGEQKGRKRKYASWTSAAVSQLVMRKKNRKSILFMTT